MKLQGMVMPGYRIYEYMLILNPHEDLRNRISEMRSEFNKEYAVSGGLGAKPNLGIANFMQYEIKEQAIIKKLKLIAMGFPPFKVELKDFGSFPSHTIFINVTSKLPVQSLVKAVRMETQSLMKLNDETKPHFFQEPHITIAMKLKPWQYEKGWLAYSHKHFTSRFIADALLLLKRPAGEKAWQIAERFELQNLPLQVTRQGELF